METMGKNIEIVPCTIREQRKVRYYNILNTTWLQLYYPAPGGSQKGLSDLSKPLKSTDFQRFFLCPRYPSYAKY